MNEHGVCQGDHLGRFPTNSITPGSMPILSSNKTYELHLRISLALSMRSSSLCRKIQPQFLVALLLGGRLPELSTDSYLSPHLDVMLQLISSPSHPRFCINLKQEGVSPGMLRNGNLM